MRILRSILIPVVLFALSASAYAQVPTIAGDDPHLEAKSSLGAWAIVFVFALAILGVAFKTSRRTTNN